MQWNPKIYLIFWGPAWDSDTSGAKTDIPQLFNSLAGTALNNILTQYSVPSFPILNSSTFGGSFADTTSYGGKGSGETLAKSGCANDQPPDDAEILHNRTADDFIAGSDD